jgi:uncharacterized protein (TIGR03118 family)
MRPISVRPLVLAAALMVAVAVTAVTAAASGEGRYTVHPLFSDVPGAAAGTDTNLVNGWGLAAGPTSPWWVADNGTDKATVYTAAGANAGLVVAVGGGPTGEVFNGTTGFTVTNGVVSGRASFIFASEDGTIRGWSPTVPAGSRVAQVAVDGSVWGAIYKGLAIATTAAGPRLYAADFHNGNVDVFDGSFTKLTVPGAFTDPWLKKGYAPFGIQTIGSRVFVSYAKQDADAEDEIAGQGLGYVDVYSTEGVLLHRVAQHGALNAPWGLALAPADFGRFSGDLLVGNFGDGRIHGYAEQADGSFENEGPLKSEGGKPLSIDGLWALEFGLGGTANGPKNTLFFTAGPDDESHGLFGSITTG